MNFKTELKDVWRKEIETLNEIDVDSQESLYKAQLERVTSIEKMLTDLEKAEMDSDEKRYCRNTDEQFKYVEIDAEKRDRKTRNLIEVTKIVVPVTAAFAMGLISMKWEKIDTLTTTAGKSALRDILKFK